VVVAIIGVVLFLVFSSKSSETDEASKSNETDEASKSNETDEDSNSNETDEASNSNETDEASNSSETDIISNVVHKFINTMDEKYEKYEIKSSKISVQIMETIVGNSLKVVEEVLQLPDVKWILENLMFEDVNVNVINNAISPVFDCMAAKVKNVGEDPELNTQWSEILENYLTSEDADIMTIFVTKVSETTQNDIESCLQQEMTDDTFSDLRTEYNTVIDNLNKGNQYNNYERMPDSINIRSNLMQAI